MNLKSTFLCSLLTATLLLLNNQTSFAQCHGDDWTALKALYDSTDGKNWTVNTGWSEMFENQEIPTENCNLDSLYGITLKSERVMTIYLSSNGLEGVLPSELRLLKELQYLYLNNNSLSENIPPEFGELSNLIFLHLNENQLSGGIPNELGSLIYLTQLDLRSNPLEGTIPPELGNLTSLQYLSLRDTDISGTIPPQLGELTQLTELYLQENDLDGQIPHQIGNLCNLTSLDLTNNKLSGCLYKSLTKLCDTVVTVRLAGNSHLNVNWENFCRYGNGECAPCFEEDWLALKALYEYTNGSQWTNIDTAKWMEIFKNESPPTDCNLDLLPGVELNENGRVMIIDLSNTNLSGSLPSELGDLVDLEWIYLGGNKIGGSLIPELGNLTNLEHLSLEYNMLTGGIPGDLANLINLRYLNISNNNSLVGCYKSDLKTLCTILNRAPLFEWDDHVSIGNGFDANWTDFCNNNAGICQKSTDCSFTAYSFPSCDKLTGIATVYYAFTDSTNSASTFSISGDTTHLAESGVEYSFPYYNNNGTYEIIATDSSGCKHPETGVYDCEIECKSNNFVEISSPAQTTCFGSKAEIVTNNVTTDANAVLAYFLYTEDLYDPIAKSDSAIFANDGTYPTNQKLYVSAVVGPPDSEGLPKINDKCTYISPQDTLFFGQQVIPSIQHNCDELTGITTVSYSFTSGQTSFDGSEFEISGDTSHTLLAGVKSTFKLPAKTNGTYQITATDNNGCSSVNNKEYNCEPCINQAGIVNDNIIQKVCFGDNAFAYAKDTIIDTNATLMYVLHKNKDVLFESDIIAWDSFGIFTNNHELSNNYDTLYISTIVGKPDSNGRPDLNNPCSVKSSSSTPFIFLDSTESSENCLKGEIIKTFENKAVQQAFLQNEGKELVIDSCSCNRGLYLIKTNDNSTYQSLITDTKEKSVTTPAEVDDPNSPILTPELLKSDFAFDVLNSINSDLDEDGNVILNNKVILYDIDTGLDRNWNYYDYTYHNAPLEICYDDSLFSSGYDFTTNPINRNFEDTQHHGTFGIRAIADSIATDSMLYIVPIKVFDANGNGNLFKLICAIFHAVDHGAHIINISAGYVGRGSAILEKAIAYAREKGVFIVCAAGNDGSNIDSKPQYPAYYANKYYVFDTVDSLGNAILDSVKLDNVISVGSINKTTHLSEFSNYGIESVTLVSYGENIAGKGLDDSNIVLSGTSVSTFFVSRELAIEIAKDTTRAYQDIWTDFEKNMLVHNEPTDSITITGKRLDIELDTLINPCFTPVSSELDTLTNNSVVITFDSHENTDSFAYQYRVMGKEAWSSTMKTDTNIVEIPNLNPCTNYEVQIQSMCFNNTSKFSSPIVFATKCGCEIDKELLDVETDSLNNATFIFNHTESDLFEVEIFKNDSIYLNTYWAKDTIEVQFTGAGNYEYIWRYECADGTWSNSSDTIDFISICLPPEAINIGGISDTTVSVLLDQYNNTDYIDYQIRLIDPEEIDPEWNPITKSNTNPFEIEYLEACKNYQIRLQSVCSSNSRSLFIIEDFKTYCEPECDLNQELLGFDIDSNDNVNITLSDPKAYSFEVIIANEDGTFEQTLFPVSDTISVTLEAGNYWWQWSKKCKNETWSDVSDSMYFSICLPPESINVINIDVNTVEVSSTQYSNTESFGYQLRKPGSDWSSTMIANSNPFQIENLQPCTDHEIRIQSICLYDSSSLSIMQNFRIDCPPACNVNNKSVNFKIDANNVIIFTISDPSILFEVEITKDDNSDRYTPRENGSLIVDSLDTGMYIWSWRYQCENGVWSSSSEVDTFTIINQCRAPEILEIDSLTDNSIRITFTEYSKAISYIVEYKTKEDTIWEKITSFTNIVLIENLDPCTDYEVQIKSECTDNDSPYSVSKDFKTLCVPCDLDNKLLNLEEDNCYLEFTINEIDPIKYEVKLSNESGIDTIYESNSTFMIEHPDTGVNYYWQWRHSCKEDGNWSLFSEEREFLCMVSVDQNIITDGSLKLYPNPTNNYVHINILDELIKRKSFVLEIQNTQGKIVYLNDIIGADDTIKIDVSNLSSGLYFLNLKYKDTVLTYKINIF